MSENTTYPLSQQFNIGYSAYEDRLILTTELKQSGHITLLLTRRMVMLMLQQILHKLPELTGLEQTPVAYWQEVLQLTHQKALELRKAEPATEQSHSVQPESPTSQSKPNQTAQPQTNTQLFLATELTAQLQPGKLLLAFKGLPVPDAMQSSCSHTPVLAISLEAAHVHQVLQLLINKATEAMWHLPLDLPWLDAPSHDQVALTVTH